LLLFLLTFLVAVVQAPTANGQGLEVHGGWDHVTGDFGTDGFNVGAAWWFTKNVTLAGDSDPSASLSSSTWRGDDWKPENLPQSQADAVQASLDAHLDFNRAYGLNQGIATPGSHAWLRDSVGEYGDQEPDGEKGVPFSGRR